MVTQTDDSIAQLRQDWKFWLDLPTTPKEYSRIDDLDEKIGALETLLLDKKNYSSMACGDGACTGLRRKDRDPPVHQHGHRADAAARRRLRREAGRPHRWPGKAHAHEADRKRQSGRYRCGDAAPWPRIR
jgi:hypothetical protein